MKGIPFYAPAACAFAALLAAAGCQPSPVRQPGTHKPASLRTPPPLPPPPKAGPEMFAATTIDTLDDQESVHFFTRGKDGTLLVFARGGHFMARAAGLDGTPKGTSATDIGAAPSGGAELVVGSLRAAADGYVLAWAEREGGRTKIATIALDAAGAARGARANLTEISDEVSWLDALPREGGSLVVWEVSRGQTVDVSAIALDAKGAASGPAGSLLTGVLGWHAAPSGGALAIVRPLAVKDGADDAGTVPTGKVALVPLDANGRAKQEVEVSGLATAQPDVVTAEIGGKLVVAWTDVRDMDTAVWTASIDKAGTKIGAPRRTTPPTGEQALVALTGADAGGASAHGLLAWEDVLRAPPDGRQIHLATLDSEGKIGKERATMAFHADGTPPDLFADASGFGAVTLAPAWQGGPPPEEAPIWPTFVRFGADLSVLSAEPVRAATLGTDGVPYLVHGLACKDGACSTLATGGQAPTPVGLVSLVSRKTEWFAPARREPDDAAPRAGSMTALYSGEQIARVSTAEISSGGSLTAWVTYFAEGDTSAKSKQDGGAEVALVPLAPGSKPGTPVSLSKKAVSVGGVAIAPAQGDKKEIAIAWVAREKGESQVYVTKVDETGKKLAQKKLTIVTRAKKNAAGSEASDVGIAWSSAENGEGWIVSWVDTRDGNAEVYVAKIDRSLTKIVPDRRLTDAPGDAAEVHLLVRGKETLVAWSDARQKPDEGRGDIFVARIETRSLSKLGAEARLAMTPAHSRSPQLAVGPTGNVWVAWVEDGEGGESAVRFAALDDKGTATTTTSLAPGQNRAMVSVALACDKACRGVVAKAAGDALLLDSFELSPAGQPGATKTLLTLPGAGLADISPVFSDHAGTSLFIGADAASGLGRVRQIKIDW